MNILTACATYTGHVQTFNGLEALRFLIPDGKDKDGKSKDIPIFVIPNLPAGDSCATGAYEIGTNLLIEGRVYKRNLTKQQKDEKIIDDRLYVVPTCPLQVANKALRKNRVDLAGGVGFIEPQNRDDVLNFGLVCSGQPQRRLNVTPDNNGVAFKISAWNDDCNRLKHLLYQGRQIALGGKLNFRTYLSKEGIQRCEYRVTIKSNQTSAFGSGKPKEKSTRRDLDSLDGRVDTTSKPEVFESPHQQAIAKTTIDIKDPVNDGIPF
jgi:single-stranded DNA-binding protein